MNITEKKNKFFLIIASVAIIGLCLFVPVWQCAVNSQLKERISNLQSEISFYENLRLSLEADIAHNSTPEKLLEKAFADNISFKQIEKTTFFAKNVDLQLE